MTEDDLVAAIARLTARSDSRILVGIGDDAAVWQPSRSARSVITTDMLVENVHFSFAYMSYEDAGWRAMAANASDLAAMGARGVLATIAFGVPDGASEDAILAWYRGMDACARRAGIEIAGGDLSRSPVWSVAITVVGEVRPSNLTCRSGARPGDVFAVTGMLGASRAGLLALQKKVSLADDLQAQAVAAHVRPHARVREGRFLAASRSVRAMMDCSDGLSTDAGRLARASGVGIRIESVPVAPPAEEAAQQLGEEPATFALAGGEDFELLVAVEARAFAHVARRFSARFGRPLFRVGVMQADERVVVVKQGREEPLTRSGWDHFS
ncbi:MAG TPA: thiamine-phosphate kinase [Candidatus Aquilonibacter sp.]|nr:thiamine-phosphate kinase [Candidatus Aquilonibacter sp.]